MKTIINAEPDDLAEVLELILEHKVDFELASARLGWGWVYPIANGRRFFLRQIKGGISAAPVKS